MTTFEAYKQKAFEQFISRYKEFYSREKVSNSDLYAGQSMYFYCKHCGIPTEKLPEDYLFPVYTECSQCKGLQQEGLLMEALKLTN